MNESTVILVHGVGRRPEGVIKNRVTNLFHENNVDVKPENIHEIEWSEQELNFIDYNNQLKFSDLQLLSSAWNNAAHMGFESSNFSSYYLKVINLLSSVFAYLFQLLTYFFPIILFGVILKLIWAIFPLEPNNQIWGEPNIFTITLIEWLCSRELIVLGFSKLLGYYLNALFFSGILSIVFGLISFSASYFLMCLRRIVLILVWSAFYTLNLVVLIPKSLIVIVIIFAFLTRGTGTILALTVEDYDVYNMFGLTIKGLFFVSLFIVGIIFLVSLLLWIFRPIMRIASDIFLYIYGYLDNHTNLISYQNNLQQNFQSQFENINPNKKLIFITHSLGTLITLDFFKNIKDKHSDSDILFVTMGSPINRLIARFFPKIIDFDNLNEFKNIKWLNIYRPFDPIGTELNCDFIEEIENVNTKQNGRIIKAHTDYWGDKMVLDAIISKGSMCKPLNISSYKASQYKSPMFFNSAFYKKIRIGFSFLIALSLSLTYVLNKTNYTENWIINKRNNFLDLNGVKIKGYLVGYDRLVASWDAAPTMKENEQTEQHIYLLFRFPNDTNTVFHSRVLVYQKFKDIIHGSSKLVDANKLHEHFYNLKPVDATIDTSYYSWITKLPRKEIGEYKPGVYMFKVGGLNMTGTTYYKEGSIKRYSTDSTRGFRLDDFKLDEEKRDFGSTLWHTIIFFALAYIGIIYLLPYFYPLMGIFEDNYY